MVQGQSRQKVHETPSQPIPGCGGMCLPTKAMREAKIGRIIVPGQPGHKKFLDHLNGKKKLNCGGVCLSF
jgi:hypothetical protein